MAQSRRAWRVPDIWSEKHILTRKLCPFIHQYILNPHDYANSNDRVNRSTCVQFRYGDLKRISLANIAIWKKIRVSFFPDGPNMQKPYRRGTQNFEIAC